MQKEAHNQFILLIKQIEEEYGKKYITPNLHLALHVNQCCLDYGPLYAFWCYSFERMNGLLGNYFDILIINILIFNQIFLQAHYKAVIGT